MRATYTISLTVHKKWTCDEIQLFQYMLPCGILQLINKYHCPVVFIQEGIIRDDQKKAEFEMMFNSRKSLDRNWLARNQWLGKW